MIQLDTRLGWLNPTVISFNAMSVGTCMLNFEITENRQILDLTNLRVMIEVKCPSGAVIEDHVEIVNAQSGLIEKELASNMIMEQGLHYVELSIYSADNKKLLVTNKARYNVGANFGEESVKATSQYAILQELIFEVGDLKDKSVIDTAYVASLKDETKVYKEYVENTYFNATELIENEANVQIANVTTEGTKQINLAKSEVTKSTIQANIATQKAQEISSSVDQINRNKQELVDSVPSGAKSGQLFFVRKG